MKFKLETSSEWGYYIKTKEDKKHIENLKNIGFEFSEPNFIEGLFPNEYYVSITKKPTIDIDTIAELVMLIDSIGIDIIMGKDSIEIYDDYRE